MPWRQRTARGDDGVIAILTALLVVAVLLPVAAIGLSAYTRTTVLDERQRSADAGALTGAARLTLTDLRAVPLSGLVDGTVLLPSIPDARLAACVEQGLSESAGDVLGDTYAPGSDCEARFGPQSTLPSCLSGLTSVVSGALAPVTGAANELVGGLTGLLAPLLVPLNAGLAPLGLGATLPAVTTELAATLTKLLPALVQNQVTVDVSYGVTGPLDAVLPGGDEPTPVTVTATARRVFKPLLPPLAELGVGPLAGVPGLPELLTDLDPTARLTVAMLQVVIAALEAALGDVQGDAEVQALLDATGQPLEDLVRPLIPVLPNLPLGLANPLNAVVAGLLDGLSDGVPVLGSTALTGLSGVSAECLTAVREVLRDLQDAVQVNDDPAVASEDALPCLLTRVLGLPLTTVGDPVDLGLDCVNQLFRARLVS